MAESNFLSPDERKGLPKEARTSNRFRLDEDEAELITFYRKTGTIPPRFLVETDRSFAKRTAQYAALQKKYRVLLETVDAAEAQLDRYLAIKKAGPKKILKLRPKTKSKTSESIPILVLADVHYGQRVDPEVVSGLNEYDTEIAEQSLREFFDNGTYLINLMKNETAVKTVVLYLAGDLMSGDIHDDLMEGNDESALEAVVSMKRILNEGIPYILENTGAEKLIIVGVQDNHGRNTKKPRVATAWKHSYAYLLYAMLGLDYAKDERIHVEYSKGYHAWLDLFGKFPIRFHHGHAIKYSGGVGGISIPANKKVDRWNKARRAYLDVFGHYHQFKYGGDWVCAPSMVGYDPYALFIGADYEPPRQLLLAIEKTKGLTKTEPILLGERSTPRTLR